MKQSRNAPNSKFKNLHLGNAIFRKKINPCFKKKEKNKKTTN